MSRKRVAAGCLCLAAMLSWSSPVANLRAQEVNLAPPFGTATQSTTGFGGEASRAIDGNTDGVYGNGSVTHTDTGDVAPFWQVDLGDIYPVTRIVLWNRTDDCCIARLSNFRVSVLEDEFDEVWGENYFTGDGEFPQTPSIEITPPEDTEGRIVRVDLLGPNAAMEDSLYLSLAEVQVFSSADIDLPPSIVRQPQGGRISAGEPFELSVEAAGSAPLEYQWLKDGIDVDGATASALSFASVTPDDAGTYTVVVSNSEGDVTSDPAVLSVVEGTNIAPFGIATQSTIGFGGEPGRGNDGNIDGVYNNGSVTHTETGDPMPWWEVDFVAAATIDRIVLWNRVDCCQTRLSNFRVTVFDEVRDDVFSEDYFTDGIEFADTSLEGFEIEVGGELGRFIRVELLGPNSTGEHWLSLAEVEVFGELSGECPLANVGRCPGAVASQSSQLGAFGPRLALDGNLGNFTHTAAGVNLPATWEVGLNEAVDIEEIVLHNRQDCCGSRLRDITVFVLDPTGANVLFESELLNPENELGAALDGPPQLSLDLVALTGDTVPGGIVRVVRTPDEDLSGTAGEGIAGEEDILSLAEVEIFKVVDCPADGDTHCADLAVAGPDGNDLGDYTFTATGNDDSGDLVFYTFTIQKGAEAPVVIGPQILNTVTMRLTPGSWTVTVSVDDDERCEDEAADSECTTLIDVTDLSGNLATSGTASQSSTGFGGDPSLAIDGNTSGVYGEGSVTHTAGGDDLTPWWEVDLGQRAFMERIEIWNRIDACCAQRLTNFRVSVLDGDRNETFGEIFFEDGFTFPDTTLEGFEVLSDEEGQIVRVELLNELAAEVFLSLAEVRVFGELLPDGGQPVFRRGDTDGNGLIEVTDPINNLTFQFLGTEPPIGYLPPCLDAADFDDNGRLEITDPINNLFHQFLSGDPPPAPGKVNCGVDPTPDDANLVLPPGEPDDELGCLAYPNPNLSPDQVVDCDGN